jgi:hypothetical protein
VVKRYAYSTLHTGKVMRGADVLPDLHSLRPQSEGILLHTSCSSKISTPLCQELSDNHIEGSSVERYASTPPWIDTTVDFSLHMADIRR